MKYRKKKLLILLSLLALDGCGSRADAEGEAGEIIDERPSAMTEIAATVSDKEEAGEVSENDIVRETIDIAESCRDIYEKAVQENTAGNQELVRELIGRLGEIGYAAVDTENQIDMVNSGLIKQFCGKIEEKQEAKTALFIVMENGDLIRNELDTAGGEVDVTRLVLNWKDGNPDVSYQNTYQAYSWTYEDNGYLFFEEYCPPGFDGAPGYTAVRVDPLDPDLRELNDRYILPVGYGLNNMFTSDWSEENFGELNFYDLYERMYQMKYGSGPFAATIDSEAYQVPEEIFEGVFMTFFRIDSRALRRSTVYLDQDKAYQYRTRGQYDFAPIPGVPYPEVAACEENPDGTIRLTVNAVWPKEHLARAFSHEVVIRLLEDGSFQYVSNHVIPSEKNVEPVWYTDRLSDEQWEEYYG